MPLFTTSQEWFDQSALLLDANPTTTRITTKYTTARNRKERLRSKSLKYASGTEEQNDAAVAADGSNTEGGSSTSHQPKAILILKTYEPHSGVCLKYETDKAAEIGRVIGALGRLGKKMAALPEQPVKDDPVRMEETEQADSEATIFSTGISNAKGGQSHTQSHGQGGVAGKKKKKKR